MVSSRQASLGKFLFLGALGFLGLSKPSLGFLSLLFLGAKLFYWLWGDVGTSEGVSKHTPYRSHLTLFLTHPLLLSYCVRQLFERACIYFNVCRSLVKLIGKPIVYCGLE